MLRARLLGDQGDWLRMGLGELIERLRYRFSDTLLAKPPPPPREVGVAAAASDPEVVLSTEDAALLLSNFQRICADRARVSIDDAAVELKAQYDGRVLGFARSSGGVARESWLESLRLKNANVNMAALQVAVDAILSSATTVAFGTLTFFLMLGPDARSGEIVTALASLMLASETLSPSGTVLGVTQGRPIFNIDPSQQPMSAVLREDMSATPRQIVYLIWFKNMAVPTNIMGGSAAPQDRVSSHALLLFRTGSVLWLAQAFNGHYTMHDWMQWRDPLQITEACGRMSLYEAQHRAAATGGGGQAPGAGNDLAMICARPTFRTAMQLRTEAGRALADQLLDTLEALQQRAAEMTEQERMGLFVALTGVCMDPGAAVQLGMLRVNLDLI
jgi:hypothetical protein